MLSPPTPCRHCGGPLGALERFRGGVCRSLSCRMAEGRARMVARRDADLAQRRRLAARQGHDAAPAAPVVWIQPHGTRLVPLPAAEREAQAQHLAALAAQLRAAPVSEAGIAPPEHSHPVTDRLCGFCRGRCCRYGRGRQAFVTTTLLQRWLDAHPGTTPEDAAAAYLALVPRRHVENSCLHHGAQGCTLPREMRSDICNTYACDGLVEAQARVDEGLPHGLVAGMEGGHGVLRAAWIDTDRTQSLPRRAR